MYNLYKVIISGIRSVISLHKEKKSKANHNLISILSKINSGTLFTNVISHVEICGFIVYEHLH